MMDGHTNGIRLDEYSGGETLPNQAVVGILHYSYFNF